MKPFFSEKLRCLRRDAGLSQEQLAEQCSVSVQAVSKWECAQSYPDIELLVALAKHFGVSVDSLLREQPEPALCSDALPDDDTLRVVQFVGQRMVCRDDFDPDRRIPLRLDAMNGQTVSVEIWGSAEIKGDIGGYVEAGHGVNCGTVGSYVEAGSGVNCGNVGSYVDASSGVNCGNVGRYVDAGQGVNCGNIDGNVNAGQGVNCGDIMKSVESCGGDIRCRTIHGNVQCRGNIIYKNDL